MKQWIACLLALTLLFALVGCKASPAALAEDPASAEATNTPASTEAPVETPTEAPTLPAPETEIPADAPEQGDENNDWDDLTHAYEIVQMGVAYENGEYSYRLPVIDEDTAGAKAINDAIDEAFGKDVREAIAALDASTDPYTIVTGLCDTDWYLVVWNGVISLIVSADYEGDWTAYEVYYYDMNSGAQLTKQDMLSRIVLTEEELLEGTREAARACFETMFGNLDEETREGVGYYDMLARLDTDELINMDMVKFAVDTNISITVFAPVPSIAGADYYYKPLYPSFAMG